MNYFMKTNHRHLAVPHTLLGMEGLLVSIPAKDGLWEIQQFTASREFKGDGGKFDLIISYDKGDPSNSLNHFSVCRDFAGVTGPLGIEQAVKFWPELAHLVKWHLCSDGEPMYYIENTLYLAANGKFEQARQYCHWLDAPQELLEGAGCYIEVALRERLPAMREEFRKDLAAIGLKLNP